jgi:hypothetical protein
MPPATLLGEGEHPRQRSLGHHREVEALTGVRGGAVELVDQR